MNFRKLLSFIGVLSVVVPTSMTVVACGTPQDKEKIQEEAIKKQLENGIDGSSLSIKSTQSDALKIMQDQEGIKGIAILSFVEKTDGIKHLEDGDNFLKINIKVGSSTISTELAKIKNVNINSDSQNMQSIKKLLEDGIDGSTISLPSTFNQALELMKANAQVKSIKAILSFVNAADGAKGLNDGDNSFDIKIQVGLASTDAKAKIKSVNKNDDTANVEAVKNEFKNGIDGSNLTTKNKGSNALDLLKTNHVVISTKAILTFNTPADGNKPLTEGDNTFTINIKVGVVTEPVTVTIKHVNLNEDIQKALEVKKILEVGIDGSSLTSKDKGSDALSLMQKAKGIEGVATLSFKKDDDANKPLTDGDNTFDINIQVESVTQPVTVKISYVNVTEDMKKAQEIQSLLEAGIDASALTIKSQGSDALTLMQKAEGIEGVATLTFANPQDADRVLTDGENTFNVNIQVKLGSASATAKIINVNKKSDELAVKNVKTALDAAAIDGSAFTTNSIGNDALKLMNNLPAVKDNKATLAFVKDGDATDKLKEGLNEFNISITVGSANTTTIVKVADVNKNADAKIVTDVKTLLDAGIDGSTLNIKNTLSDAVKKMQNLPKVKDVAILSLVDATKAANLLTQGNNTINVKITVGIASTTTSVTVSKVNQNDNTAIINAINETTYNLGDVKDGDKAQAQKDKITKDFITAQFSEELKGKFIDANFRFNDITIANKPLTDDNLKIVGTIHASITYTYAGIAGSTQLIFTVDNKYSDGDMQTFLSKAITTENPLTVPCHTKDAKADAIVEISNYLKDKKNTSFDKYLTDEYKTEFTYSKLGVYAIELYNSAAASDKIADDFFKTEGTKTAFVYIAYNSTADASGHGIYVPITITVSNA